MWYLVLVLILKSGAITSRVFEMPDQEVCRITAAQSQIAASELPEIKHIYLRCVQIPEQVS